MCKKHKFWISICISTIIMICIIFFFNLDGYVKFSLMPKENMILSLNLINPQISALTADSSNRLVLRVKLKNRYGEDIPSAKINISSDKKLGQFLPHKITTDKYGEALITYIPPYLTREITDKNGIDLTITAILNKSDKQSSVCIKLLRVPIIFIHGYQENASVFDNLNEYLTSKGFNGNSMGYNSANGIISGSKDLTSYIQKLKTQYLSKGIQVNKFDIIAHSMGGLISRYYTCSEEYLQKDDIRKIIFLSVPQKGSPWASIGAGYFNDQGIKDLIPDNPIITKALPEMTNSGLNNTNQVGSIMVQFDEVVSTESAALTEWDIKTELFNVGENNFTMDKLLNGKVMDAPNHKNVLNNKKVFEKVETMLFESLPYPSLRK